MVYENVPGIFVYFIEYVERRENKENSKLTIKYGIVEPKGYLDADRNL